MDTRILQSLIAINANNISATQAFYQSYKDILKDFRECGKSDDEAYSRYTKLKDKELRKLHLLERNQRELLAELKWVQKVERFVADSEGLCTVGTGCIYYEE